MVQYPAGGERLRGLFTELQNWGFQDFFLPTALIFALLFAILQKIRLFTTPGGEGEQPKPNRKLNGILSLVIALLVVIPHVVGMYPQDVDPINILNQMLPSTALLLVALLVAMLLIGLFTKNAPPQSVHLILGFIATIVLFFVIIKATFPHFAPRWIVDSNTSALVIVILTMALVGWYVMYTPKERRPEHLPYRGLRRFFGLRGERNR